MADRIGIVGIGNAANMHASAIDELPEATVVAASCRTESKGRDFASAFDSRWYESTERMYEDADLDIAVICTPSAVHREPTVAAIEREIDVLCEKPLEVTTDDVDHMIETAADHDVRLGGVFQQRYNPVVQTVHEAAMDGRFGDLAVANAVVPWWRDDEYFQGSWKGTPELDGGGALMNQAIHSIDAIQWLAGAAMEYDLDEGTNPVAEVTAYADTSAHDPDLVEVEDTAVAILRYRDGTLGQLLGTTSMYPGSLRRIQLAGRDGTATIHGDELEMWHFRDERSADEEIRMEFTASETSGGASDPMDVDVSNHRRNIEAFLEARRTGDPFLLDAPEARKAIEIVQAIYESAESGESVPL